MFQTIKDFFSKHKVMILGFLSAVALPLHELITKGAVTDNKVLVFAGATAALTWFARNLRGQWATISGVVLTTFAVYVAMHEAGGEIQWRTIIMTFAVQLLAALSSPPKDRGYEKTSTIVDAKAEGKEITKEGSEGASPKT